MTSDRLRRIESVCRGALPRGVEDREAFLTAACAGDDELRREVESLLAQEHKAAGFMSVPASAVVVSAVLDQAKGTLAGQRFGAYTIGPLIGAGGMGEVYRARDETLGREVAIKVLAPAFTADPVRRARFEREARMLATLNHPHVGAIYGIEDVDGVRGLVLELIEGETLAEHIAAAGRLSIADMLVIARQIADALDAAHEKGIVHRDLKPANIKIAPDGAVKVLDFGLAKAARTDGSPQDVSASIDGAIFGTATYMSPEQARGQTVDHRGDIWAFGCIVYEMLTGRPAFHGDTVSDTIARIIEREPDWSALPAETPAPVRRLVRRCLAKDRKRRLRDIGDLQIEIDAVDEVQPKTRTMWFPWVALVALAAGVGVGEAWRPAPTFDNPLADARFSLLTNWEGAEEGAEISPDGRLVAFLSDFEGEYDLYVTQVGTGQLHNLTQDLPPLSASGSIVRKLGFTSDGSEIWYNPGDGKPLMLIPVTGGRPHPFLRAGANTPAWSPDEKHVAYVYKADGDDPVYVTDRTFADPQPIFPPGTEFKNMNPVWSPDSQWVYFGRGSEPQDETVIDVWRVRALGGPAERLTTQHLAVNFLTPIDLRTLLYVARAEDGSGPWLWALNVESGRSQRVASGVDQYTSVSASRDGRRIVATAANPSASLWRVPLDRIASESDAKLHALPVQTGRALAPRFDQHGALFYLSARGTRDGLWRINEDGQASDAWYSVDGALSEPPAVSRDGKRLAVVVRKEGKRRLAIMSADGTGVSTLAPSIDIEGAAGQGAADWSPDGTRIVTGGRDAHGPALFMITVDTGVTARLKEGKWVNPVWSKNDLIVYAGRSLIGQVALQGMRPDGTAVDLPPVLVRPGGYRFLPDGSGLVYLERITSLDFMLLDLATLKPRPLTHLTNQGTLRTFDITPDGKFIVFDRSRQNSNIVLIEKQ